MDLRNQFSQILQSFAQGIQLPNLKLDEKQCCELCINDKSNIFIQFNEEQKACSFICKIGELNEEYLERFCDCLLKANADWDTTQGLTLSKEQNSKNIWIGYQVPILNLTTEAFASIFRKFIDNVKVWEGYAQQMYQGELPDALAAF